MEYLMDYEEDALDVLLYTGSRPRSFEDQMLLSVEVVRLIARLSDKEKAVIALRNAGFRQKAVADLLGISRASVGLIETGTLTKIRTAFLAEGL
jgi:DNA-directed RNA polymerase specialized sigma subunit